MTKKCPFCGGNAHIRTRETRFYGMNYEGDKKVRQSVYVYCGRCHARGPIVIEDIVLTAKSRHSIPIDMMKKAFEYWDERENE